MWKECPAEHIQYTLQRSVTSLHARWMGGGGGEAKTAGIALPLKVKQSHNVPRTITFTYGWLTRHHNCQLMIGGSSRFVKSKLMAKSDKIPETVCVPGMPDNLSKIRHIILPPLALSRKGNGSMLPAITQRWRWEKEVRREREREREAFRQAPSG